MEVCRLCLDLAVESDVKKLEGTYKDATQIVLPEVNTDISSSPVICQQCTSSLDELYAFKASVVEAENQIREKVGENKCQLGLKEVMTGVKVEKDADLGKSKDRMCRTCLCAIEGETFTILKPTQSDAYLNSMLLMCLPEMELELTLDPVMCEQCLCNLQKLYHFKSSCLDIEERLNSYCQQHGTSSNSQINLHSVLAEDAAESKDHNFTTVKSEPIDSSVGDYKSEEDDDDVSMSDNSKDLGYTVVKVKKEERDMMLKEEDDTEDGDESMGDDAGSITDEEIGELKQEELKIEDDDEDGTKKEKSDPGQEVLKCEYCEYTHKDKRNLTGHVIRKHKQDQLPLLTCDLCNYTTRVKQYLHTHFRFTHDDIPVLKCKQCRYTTKRKHYFNIHVARCHQQDELEVLKCELCGYTSRIRANLQIHIRRNHKKTPPVKRKYCEYITEPIYILKKQVARQHKHEKRDLCKNKSPTKETLQIHVKRERRIAPLLKCGHCEYTTGQEYMMERHVVQYHSVRKQCEHCSFTSRCKAALKKHTETLHQIHLLKCHLCNYSSGILEVLKNHIRDTHKQPCVIKCDFCPYVSYRPSVIQNHISRVHKDQAVHTS